MQQQSQQPRADEDDEQDKPERAPNFLTARELQARAPARGTAGQDSPPESPEPKKKR